jgi:hypothetical protein
MSSTDFRKNTQISNLLKIRLVEAELFHADGQTYGNEEAVCSHQSHKEIFTSYSHFHYMVYKISRYNCLQQFYVLFYTQILDVYTP